MYLLTVDTMYLLVTLILNVWISF